MQIGHAGWGLSDAAVANISTSRCMTGIVPLWQSVDDSRTKFRYLSTQLCVAVCLAASATSCWSATSNVDLLWNHVDYILLDWRDNVLQATVIHVDDIRLISAPGAVIHSTQTCFIYTCIRNNSNANSKEILLNSETSSHNWAWIDWQ